MRLQSDFVDSYGHMEHNSTEQWQCFYLIFFSIYIFFSFKHIPLTSIICLQKMMTAMLHAQWAGVRIMVLKKCTIYQKVNLHFLLDFWKKGTFHKVKKLHFFQFETNFHLTVVMQYTIYGKIQLCYFYLGADARLHLEWKFLNFLVVEL